MKKYNNIKVVTAISLFMLGLLFSLSKPKTAVALFCGLNNQGQYVCDDGTVCTWRYLDCGCKVNNACSRCQTWDCTPGTSGGGCLYGLTCNTSCTRKSNCPVARQGAFCGYTKVKPIEQKVDCRTCFCNPAPSCTATAPTNVTVTPISATSATITWTPGTGGTSQQIYVGTDSAAVTGNCPGGIGGTTGCVVAATLTATQTSYTTGSVLVAGTLYYYKIVNFQSSTCSGNSAVVSKLSSCILSPSVASMTQGSFMTLNTNVSADAGVTSVTYSSASPTNVSVTPTSDTETPYQTLATALLQSYPAAITITSKVFLTGSVSADCTSTSQITVLPPAAWWQVKDSDIGSNGDLESQIPTSLFFGLKGNGGYAGVPAYAGLTNLTSTNVSEDLWLAASPNSGQKIYDYAYFNNQIPADTNITVLPSNTLDQGIIDGNTTPSYGYYWYKFNGTGGLDFNISSDINIGTKKVILLVDSANFNINGKINLTDGQGFFMVIVGKNSDGNKGNIFINPSFGGGIAPNIEGIYLADGIVDTGEGNTQLSVRGSVVGYGGIVLKRDLAGGIGNGSPAEFFEYAPDQILLFPGKLGVRKINWKEVAP